MLSIQFLVPICSPFTVVGGESMFRALRSLGKGVVPNLRSQIHAAAKVNHGRTVIAFRGLSDDAKLKAHEELKNAVRELSEGTAVPISYAPVSTLLEWNKRILSTLSTEQLEELARAWFEGVEDELETDFARAYEVWSVAAQRGSIEAQYSLAVCLRQGLGVAQNQSEAFRTMKQLATDKNYGLAHYAAAIMLHSGEGTAQDYTQSFHHFHQAGLAGITPALHNMANAFANGHGVPVDEARAAKFYEGACEVGDPAAKFTLGTWLYRGRGGLAVDKKRSFKLQLEAAQAGHPGAMFNTGAAYMEGEAEPQDFAKAAEWFEKAADRGVVEACVNLGNLHRSGLGVPRSLSKAAAIFGRYAAQHEVCAELLKEVQAELAAETERGK